MREVQITITLPEELVNRVHAAGIAIDSITPDMITLLEQRLSRKEAWQHLAEAAQQLRGSLTEAEIEAELTAAKAERLAGAGTK
jgi:post-segregation antitoxin (ccd killing protein)